MTSKPSLVQVVAAVLESGGLAGNSVNILANDIVNAISQYQSKGGAPTPSKPAPVKEP